MILVHKTGHLYVLFGAIRANDKLLCQVLHGNEPVSLVTKQALLEGGFQEVWCLEKTKGAGVPIHVGKTVVNIDKLWHNFGEVFPTDRWNARFDWRRWRDTTVILDKPTVSCRCVLPKMSGQTTLSPREAFDLRIATQATGITSMRNSVGLTFYEKGSGVSRRVQLTLIGSQRESMEVNPRTLDFGLMVPGKTSSRLICLCEKPADRFLLKKVDPGKLPITHRVETTRDKNGLATYRVNVELEAEKELPGEHRGELTFTTDSYVRPTVTVPVTFQVEPPVRAIPSVIALGTVAVGEPREERLRLVCRSGGRSTSKLKAGQTSVP